MAMQTIMETDKESIATRRYLWPVVFLCLLSIVSAGCSTTRHGEFNDVAPFGSLNISKTQAALQKILAAEMQAAPDPSGSGSVQSQLVEFYTARDFRPVWTGSKEAMARGSRARFTLEHAYRQGLQSTDYPTPPLQADHPPKTGKAAAEYDLLMTKSLFRYAHDVRAGRVQPTAVYQDVGLPTDDFDFAAALTAALEQPSSFEQLLADLPPPHPAYRRLVAALAHYRAINARGGWPRLPEKSAVPRKMLIRRLAIEDPAFARIKHPSATEIKHAVMRFQKRNGLDIDGDVGSATVRALNISAFYRVKEIIANMERWRWMPREFESRFIRVNVPDQSVDFIHNGKVVLHSKVVIGRPNSTTPILRTTAKSIVANPPWDIPDDIAARAILPHLRQNANYLAQRNMVLVDGPPGDPRGTEINWQKVKPDDLPYQIQQSPGPHNALGKLMLDSPNDFDVYLHDTPSKFLFKLDNRERSNGCVRVQKILPLATLVLAGTVANPKKELTQAIESGKTQRLTLSKPLPIYMVYWTASALPNGTVEFRPDRYKRDVLLIARLGGRNS